MIGSTVYFIQNSAFVLIRTIDGISHAVGDTDPIGIRQIIFFIFFVNPDCFKEMGEVFDFIQNYGLRTIGNHVIIQPDDVQRILSDKQISCAIIVNEDCRIDKVTWSCYSRTVP